MTAEERMRERAERVCQKIKQEYLLLAKQAQTNRNEAHCISYAESAEECESAIRALPLEGEQDQRAPIKYRAELIFDHETRIIHGTIDEPQGEPAEDQRGAAAIPTDTRAATVSDGAASKYRVEHDPSQSAPHHQRAERVKADARSVSQDDPASAHHSRTEQVLPGTGQNTSEIPVEDTPTPAPAREPAVEKTGPIDLPISIDGEEWMAYLDYEMLHRDALLKDKEIDRLRAENAAQAARLEELSVSYADVRVANEARKQELAALREQLQGGVVVSEEVAARFSGDITVPKALLAEAYRGLKLHYEMPEVRREIDRLFAAAKEAKK